MVEGMPRQRGREMPFIHSFSFIFPLLVVVICFEVGWGGARWGTMRFSTVRVGGVWGSLRAILVKGLRDMLDTQGSSLDFSHA